MAMVAARNGNDVLLWAHDPKVAEGIAREGMNPVYLPGMPLGERITATLTVADPKTRNVRFEKDG
jgi:glycerol-3-phosphate dehydrogenase